MASRRVALLVFAVVVIAGALGAFLPALLKQRDVIVASPSPPPLLDVTPVSLRAGQRVCIADVTLDPQAAIARFELATAPRADTRARLTVTGSAGYRASAAVTPPNLPGPLDVPLTPRPPRAQTGTVCLRSQGAVPLRLVGSTEPRTLAAAPATIDGRTIAPRVALILLASHPRSLLARVPQILAHASAFRPGWLGRPVLWVLLIAVAIGVPVGIGRLIASAQERPTGDAPASGAAAGIGKSTP